MTGDRIERRLAAILAADVAGFSALMERNEEGTYSRIGTLRREVIEPRLSEHHGRLIKTTGDGFLAEFASPIAALRCALSIQESLFDDPNALRLRIGINLGDVIIEQGGDVYGEGINVAARLEGLADPGGILISGKIHSEVEGKVTADFEDLGERQVKNISRPIRMYAVRPTEAVATPSEAVAAAGMKTFSLPDKPSIAVLPFQNMSGDPEQEYFADGMVEEIITALSRFKSLFVIARNSSFTYKGKAVDIKRVGRELGVRYVLEGSVRKSGGHVRITGQLIEAGTGTHLWADKFDGELKEVFELQDLVTANVVSVIAPKIQQSEIERARAKPTDRLDSYDFFLRGIAAYADRSKWGTAELRDWFKKASERDPDYAAAQVMLAYCALSKQATLGVPLSAEERAEAIQIAERASALAIDDSFVLSRAAHIFVYLGQDYDRAEAMIEEAVALNTNDAAAWAFRGWISLMCVEPARAIESFERRLQLSPLDPGRASSWNGMSFAHFLLGEYDQGCAIAAKALAMSADAHTLCALIMNHVAAKRFDEARKSAERLLQLRPDFRASHARKSFPTKTVEWGDRMVAVLREAGVPE